MTLDNNSYKGTTIMTKDLNFELNQGEVSLEIMEAKEQLLTLLLQKRRALFKGKTLKEKLRNPMYEAITQAALRVEDSFKQIKVATLIDDIEEVTMPMNTTLEFDIFHTKYLLDKYKPGHSSTATEYVSPRFREIA